MNPLEDSTESDMSQALGEQNSGGDTPGCGTIILYILIFIGIIILCIAL